MTAAVELCGITKQYGGRTVIDGLSQVFEPGLVYRIEGPSGCGKSTLLRIIAGIDRDYSGRVDLHGAVVSMSPQGGGLIPGITAAENVMIAMTRGRGGRTVIRDAAAASFARLRELGIDGGYSMMPSEYSGGMRARVGIARALARKADLYLFDEPFAALDSSGIATVSSVIKARTAGKTVICVVHDSITAHNGSFYDVTLRMTGSPVSGFEMTQCPDGLCPDLREAGISASKG